MKGLCTISLLLFLACSVLGGFGKKTKNASRRKNKKKPHYHHQAGRSSENATLQRRMTREFLPLSRGTEESNKASSLPFAISNITSGQSKRFLSRGTDWTTGYNPSLTTRVSPRFSEENGGNSASGAIIQISCFNDFCDDKNFHFHDKVVNEPVIFFLSFFRIVVPKTWTDWFSEESSGRTCPDNTIVSRILCSGRYCDDMRLGCSPVLSNFRIIDSVTSDGSFFSEEGKNWGNCPNGYYVYGIDCRGRYCDDIRLRCKKVEYAVYFDACSPISTQKNQIEVQYNQTPSGDENVFRLQTKATFRCKNAINADGFWYPAIKESVCQKSSGQMVWTGIAPGNQNFCKCETCPDLKQTAQTQSGVAEIRYEQQPQEGLPCPVSQGASTVPKHPRYTLAKISCKHYPFMFRHQDRDSECRGDGSWSNLPQQNEDYCQCAVQCKGFCLGAGGKKSSISMINFLWENSNTLQINWNDDCSDTNDSSYAVDVIQYNWDDASNKWIRSSNRASFVTAGVTELTVANLDRNIPDYIPYVPGLKIKFRFQQKTIVGSYSADYVYPAEEKEQTEAETKLPFFFDFTYQLTSSDGSVDISGATIQISDASTGTVFHESLSKARSINSDGSKGDSEVITVQLPTWITSTSREMNVTMIYRNHTILCDKPSCSELKPIWTGTIVHSTLQRFFFTDVSVVKISGTVQNMGCPVKNVNFRVKYDTDVGNEVEVFENASDSLGHYEIYGPLGQLIVEPYLNDRQFRYRNDYTNMTYYSGLFNEGRTGLNFIDITKRKLKMNVVGGDKTCNATLGHGYANIQVPGGCFTKYLSIDPKVKSHDIPALEFNLKVDVFNNNMNYAWVWEGDKKFQNFEEYLIATKQYNKLGWHELDARSDDVDITFRYHPVVSEEDINIIVHNAQDVMATCVNGVKVEHQPDTEILNCNEGIPNNIGNLWLLHSGRPDSSVLNFAIQEKFGSQSCPAHGHVHISENWSGNTTYHDETIALDDEGSGVYEFIPGSPDFGCPFTKSLFYWFVPFDDAIAPLELENESNFIKKFEAMSIIAGTSQAYDQTMHSTSPETVFPLMILRDPPGANSFSSVTKSKQLVLESSLTASYGGGIDDNAQSGLGLTLLSGLGVATESENQLLYQSGLQISKSTTNDSKKSFIVETTSSFQSSVDPALTGKYGDVIIGIGLTATIIPAYEIMWVKEQCSFLSRKTLAYKTDVNQNDEGQYAVYSYTHWYIENVLIPDLLKIENDGENNEEVIKKARKSRTDWQTILNEKELEDGVDPFSDSGAFVKQMDSFLNELDSMWGEVEEDGLLTWIVIQSMTASLLTMNGFVSSLNVPAVLKSYIAASLAVAISIDNFAQDGSLDPQKQVQLRDAHEKLKKEYEQFKKRALFGDDKRLSLLTFDGGHAVSGSSAVSEGMERTVQLEFSLGSQLGSFARNKLGGFESESSSIITADFTISRRNTNAETQNTIMEWTVHDPDIGDHYLIDILEDPKYGSPMFKVLSGVSSCRHEENTIAREGVEIAIEGRNVRRNLSPHEPAVFIVKLRHTGYDPEYPWYNVRLVRSSLKGYTGPVYLGGHSLTNYIEFTNLVKDQWVKVELVVHRSYTSYSFEDLTLEIYSTCEDEFARNAMPVEQIHDTASVSGFWLEPCAEVEVMPTVEFVSIKSSTISPMPIEIFNPSHQVKPWHSIQNLEVKLVWEVWTPDGSASKQYAKIDDEDIVKTQQMFIDEFSATSSLDWDISSLKDGKYSIHVELQCPGRAPEYTLPKTVYVQREELQVAGYTQPPDGGMYHFEEDIKIQFNRELNCFNPIMALNVQVVNDPTIGFPVHLICHKNTVVGLPTLAADLSAVAGQQLRITLSNVMDFAGNYLNSNDGMSTRNGISFKVNAQGLETISQLHARISMCISDNTVIGSSKEQLIASKSAFIKSIQETFGYLGDIHKCRLDVSDPYYLDSSCPNGRWDLLVLSATQLSDECKSNLVQIQSPFEVAHLMNDGISKNNMEIHLVDLNKPVALSFSPDGIGKNFEPSDPNISSTSQKVFAIIATILCTAFFIGI